MGHAIVPAEIMGSETNDLTAQRLIETEAAIREQRRHLDRLSDPAARAIAARTLAALEDMLLIMQRTMQVAAPLRETDVLPDAH